MSTSWARRARDAVWERTDAPAAPARVWRDWVLMAVIVPAAVLEGVFRTDLAWPVPSTVLALAVAPTLLWRRTRPLAMVVVAFGAILVFDVVRLAAGVESTGLVTMIYALLLPYSLFRWGTSRQAGIGLAVMLVPAVVGVVADYTGLAEAIGGFAVFFSSIALGEAVRWRANARDRRLEQLRLVEREEIARDLHDTVAHHVSAIAIRAQAGLATCSREAGRRPPHASALECDRDARLRRTLTRNAIDGGPVAARRRPRRARPPPAHGGRSRAPVAARRSRGRRVDDRHHR